MITLKDWQGDEPTTITVLDNSTLAVIKRWVRANTEYQQQEAYGKALPTVDSKKLLEYLETLVVNNQSK